jgi:hypothetical protein
MRAEYTNEDVGRHARKLNVRVLLEVQTRRPNTSTIFQACLKVLEGEGDYWQLGGVELLFFKMIERCK